MGPFSISLYLYIGLALFSLLAAAVTARVNPVISLLFVGSFIYFVVNAVRAFREDPYDLRRLRGLEEQKSVPPVEVLCPFCGEIYQGPSPICPHCGRSVNT